MIFKILKSKYMTGSLFIVIWTLCLLICPSPEVVNSLGKGDFVAPVYNAEKNEVTYEGKVYDFDRASYVDQDKVSDGVEETLIQGFISRSDSNKRLIRYTTEGRNWGWAIYNNVRDRKTDHVNNFAIRDSDGDGKFDEKFGADVSFYLPDYLRSE